LCAAAGTALRGRTYTSEERRAFFTSFLAVFVAGLGVFVSFDFVTGQLMPYAWYIIPLGFVAGAAIFLALRSKAT